MTALEDFDGLLARSGVSLATLRIRDIGLTRADALTAVEILRHGDRPILGGDAYFWRGERIDVAYANWYADTKPGEDWETYLRRSWDEAETYIKNFPEPVDAKVLFGITVDKQLRSYIRVHRRSRAR